MLLMLAIVHNQTPRCMQGLRPADVLVALDASKQCQTAPPDLAATPVHFVALSFYKVFGYPTGVGALVVRSDCMPLLRPPFHGGGTVQSTLPASWPSQTQLRQGVAAFEPGTPNYHAIMQLPAGFAAWHRAAGGGAAQECFHLASTLAEQVADLPHSNGARAAQVYAWPAASGNSDAHAGAACSSALGIGEAVSSEFRGATVPFNLYDSRGQPISCHVVADHLAQHGVAVRAGCCCNPGACAALLGFSDADLAAQHAAGNACDNDVGVLSGRHVGLVRASLGVGSTAADVGSLMAALKSFVDTPAAATLPAGQQSGSASSLHTGQAARVAGHACTAGASAGKAACQKHGTSCCEQVQLRMLALYPVKSCGGQVVDRWPMQHAGLWLDRAFQIVGRGGKALQLARYPALLNVHAAIDLQQGRLHLSDARCEAQYCSECGVCGTSIAVPLPWHLAAATPGGSLPSQSDDRLDTGDAANGHSACEASAWRRAGYHVVSNAPIPCTPLTACSATSRGSSASSEAEHPISMASCKGTQAQLRRARACKQERQCLSDITPRHEAASVAASPHEWLSHILQQHCFLACTAPPSPEIRRVDASTSQIHWLSIGTTATASMNASCSVQAPHTGDHSCAAHRAQAAKQSFASKAPLLVCSTGSIAAFRQALDEQQYHDSSCSTGDVSAAEIQDAVQRFRANLVFSTCSKDLTQRVGASAVEVQDGAEHMAHIEDQWQTVTFDMKAGSSPAEHDSSSGATPMHERLVLQAQSAAKRCTAINAIDQLVSGNRGRNALRALTSYRQADVGLTWGVYMRPVWGT